MESEQKRLQDDEIFARILRDEKIRKKQRLKNRVIGFTVGGIALFLLLWVTSPPTPTPEQYDWAKKMGDKAWDAIQTCHRIYSQMESQDFEDCAVERAPPELAPLIERAIDESLHALTERVVRAKRRGYVSKYPTTPANDATEGYLRNMRRALSSMEHNDLEQAEDYRNNAQSSLAHWPSE